MRDRVRSLFVVGAAALAVTPLAWGLPRPGHAPQPTTVAVPDALRPWVPWVLAGHESALCPVLDGATAPSSPRASEGAADTDAAVATRCAWPARLSLVLDDKGGRFSQEWRVVGAPATVRLPGDEKRWPQDVQVDGHPAVVLAEDDEPSVRLPPGEHVVGGTFAWEEAPESLPVPPETGLLALTVRGRVVPLPSRDAEGQVWLEKRAEAEKEADVLEVAVYRRVSDDIPLRLTTSIQLRVSGRSREVLLGRALPDGFVPLQLTSPLPARLERDQRLRVQVRPGTFTLELVARHDGPAPSLSRPTPGGPWKEGDEVWVFEARPELRVVTVEGVAAIDPQQTAMPDEWKRLPTYAVKLGDALKLVELRRGDAEPAPDRLSLRRELWLDFDGGGWTARDAISGTLSRSWRMEVLWPTELGRVSVAGRDQFITVGERGHSGVEVRQGSVRVDADSRLPRGAGLPAVGWDADFHEVAGTLHLPPGWRLFHAAGVDDVPGTWIGGWSLLDLFLALIIALAVARLYGWPWGALALAALALTFTEPDAPRWIWLALLLFEALARLLPEGRVSSVVRFARLVGRVALVLIGVSFAVAQVRQGIHPALAGPGAGERSGFPLLGARRAPASAAVGMLQREEAADGAGAAAQDALARSDAASTIAEGGGLKKQGAKSPSANLRQYVEEYDPNQMVQTGPGLPGWSWSTLPLRWSGPVERAQRLSLWLVPPWANFVLALLRVALLALLVLRLIESQARGASPSWPSLIARAAPLALLLALPGTARADLPGKEVLDELRQRLTREPECRPHCATSSRMMLEATPTRLRLRMEVDAAAPTGVPLPGSSGQWLPEQVLLDGRPAAGLMVYQGHLWIELPPGSHQVILEGPLPARDTVQIALPQKPHRVTARTDGWRLEGLHEDGLADDDLQLGRERAPSGEGRDAAGLQPGALPPFVRVERRLTLGLLWQAETRVVRVSPLGSAVVVEVPLLGGESVTTAEVRVVGGKALVNLGPTATEVTWRSLLKERPDLRLEAPREVPWTEVWQLEVSPIWHVALAGIPVVHQLDDAGVRRPEWRPWPGEVVTIAVSRPKGIPGQTLTIDGSELTLRPGLRATDATLSVDLRASRGGRHELTLPDGAVVQSLAIGGQSQPIRQDGARLLLPITPGSQRVDVAWRQPDGITAWFRAPRVGLGAPSVNARQSIEPGEGRWVLLAGGPRLGPAVLFWSVLLVICLVAVGLGRVRLTPLRAGHWLLLGLGLSQVPVAAAAVVVAWLLAVGWRAERPGLDWKERRLWNLRQVLLVAWSVAALAILVASIHEGLLGRPEMQIEGNGSSAAQLLWYTDRAASELPRPWVLSVPIVAYRVAMLAWALWLASALLGWLRWAWGAFSRGALWRGAPPAPPPASKDPPPPASKDPPPPAAPLPTPSA